MSHLGKIALLSAFVLRPCHWDAEADAWSRLLPHDWPGQHTGSLGRKVQAGEYSALEVVGPDQQRTAIVVFAIDRSFPAPEFVVKAAYSAAGGLDLTAEFLPQIEAQAAAHGCATVRFTTMRPGLIAKTIRAGWRISEVVVRKTLPSHHG